MIEKKFIKQSIRKSEIDEYLAKEFARAGFSHSEIQRTPLAVRVTVFAQKPGIVIGRGGKSIEALTNTLKEKFGMENPQVDVQEVEKPDLDVRIMANQIASTIERGLNYKRVVNFMIKRIMDAGAVGVAIRVSGKVGGEKSRTDKFSAGYLKFAGEPAEKMGKAYAEAKVKLGLIGVQVRILTEMPKELLASRRITREIETEKAEEKKEEPKEEKPTEKPEEVPKEEKKEEPIEKETVEEEKEDTVEEKEEEKNGDIEKEGNEGTVSG